LATAQLFVTEGAYVFITAARRNRRGCYGDRQQTRQAFRGGVAKLADLDRLFQTVRKAKRRIDITFANAGVGEFVPLPKVSEQHFDKLFNINVKGGLFTVQKGLSLLNDGGSIILTG
jgi:NAD(P)-dependent dehydrogenase (short-subunit alcohol dehydrogenase family)